MNFDDKPIEYDELKAYMASYERAEKEPDVVFTELIVGRQLHQALLMLTKHKNLKYDVGHGFTCDTSSSSYTCKENFKDVVSSVCLNADYMNVVQLLRYLEPANIISSDCCDCEEFKHDYAMYCWKCIYNGYYLTARAIYISFDVDGNRLFNMCCSQYDVEDVRNAYDIIMGSYDIVKEERRKEPELNILDLYNKHSVARWYYELKPELFTEEIINELLQLVKKHKPAHIERFNVTFRR